MEQAIAELLRREQQWRVMLTVALVQMSGLWLVIAMLEHRAYRLRHGMLPPRWHGWYNRAIAVVILVLAVTLWWVP